MSSLTRCLALLLTLLGGNGAQTVEPHVGSLAWQELATMPAKTEVAGAFAGVSHDALIFGGRRELSESNLGQRGTRREGVAR